MTVHTSNTLQKAVIAAKRMHYLDHLKVALTMLVIAHHASQPYAPMGGEWPISNPTTSAVLMPFQTVNAAFFMGLFFLISGYFVSGAYERKGAGVFLKRRLIRLGLPALIFALFVFGPAAYFIMGARLSLIEFISQLYQGGWQVLYAHLWFLLHLLVFSIGYALWRLIGKRIHFRGRSEEKLSWHAILMVFLLILGLITWVVRFRYSVNEWVALLFLVPAEMAHVPQYLSMFVLGILAYRFKALERLPKSVGMIWLGIGLFSATGYYVDNLIGGRLMVSLPISGLNTGSLIWSIWEALTCVGLGVGLMALFREWINDKAGSLMAAITRAQYGAYIIHFVVVLGVQAGLTGFAIPAFFKFVIVTIIAAFSSFGISHLFLKIPLVRKVI